MIGRVQADESPLPVTSLATLSDFRIGTTFISPAIRTVAGPGGSTTVEPRVMQVLIVLAEAGEQIVPRGVLFQRCWAGVCVGDESLNRVIAALRKTLKAVGSGLKIKTISRSGYLLRTSDRLERTDPVAGAPRTSTQAKFDRRTLLLASGAGAITLSAGAAGLLRQANRAEDEEFESLLFRGRHLLAERRPGSETQAIATFRRAVELDSRNAEALGLLAFASAVAAQSGDMRSAAPLERQAEADARAALALDAGEANARLALIELQKGLLGWAERERLYRAVVHSAPANVNALRSLAQSLFAVGRCREAYSVGSRAAKIDPLAADLQSRQALRSWSLGRVADADRVSDWTMERWPTHPLVIMTRLMIFAFTDRPRAAMAIVANAQVGPRLLSPAAAETWRASLAAIERPDRSTRTAARDANLAAARSTPAIAAWAILTLSAIGELDAAFELAEGFLLGRGSMLVDTLPGSNSNALRSSGWRNTFGLFTPPARTMRLDPRFQTLAGELGLNDYWRRKGSEPDAFLFA